MLLRVSIITFIILEPFLPVRAFFWSNISYQFLLWFMLFSFFGRSQKTRTQHFAMAGIIAAVFFRPGICGLTFPWSNSVYLVLLAAIFLISFFGRRDLTWTKTALDIPIICFLALASGFLLISLNREAGARQLISLWGAGILYFVLIREIKDERTARNIVFVFLMAGLKIMANGIYQLRVGLQETKAWIETYVSGEVGERLLDRLSSGRVFSSFVYPNAYAGFLIMLIPVAFFWMLGARGHKKIGPVFFLAISFYSLYITYSKGGWLSLALTAVFASFFLIPELSALKKISIGIFAIGLIFFLVIGLESTGRKKLGFIDSFKARAGYWQAGVLMLRDNPLKGYGLGNFSELYPEYKLPEAEETQLAHNNYLQVWVEMGILGLFILLWIVFNFLREGISGPCSLKGPWSQGIFWGVLAFFIHGFVDFDFYVPNLLFSAFFLIGVFMAVNAGKKEYIVSKKNSLRLAYCGLGFIIFFVVVYNQICYINYLWTAERVKSLISEKKFDRAEQEMDILLRRDVFNPVVHFDSGRLNEIMAFSEKKKEYLPAAIYEYSLAAFFNPRRPGYHFRLGMMYWALRDEPAFFKKAVSEFKLAHKSYPAKKEYKEFLERISGGHLY